VQILRGFFSGYVKIGVSSGVKMNEIFHTIMQCNVPERRKNPRRLNEPQEKIVGCGIFPQLPGIKQV
jgi:hypothetical protein